MRAALIRAGDEAMGGNPHLYDQAAKALWARVVRGDISAWKEIADRLDGRVPYKVGGDEEGEPLKVLITGVPRPEDG